MAIKSGELDKIIAFFSYVRHSDGAGGWTNTINQNGYSTHAKVTPIRSDRVIEGSQDIFRNQSKFVIRKNKNHAIELGWLMVYNNKNFTIQSIIDQGYYIELIAFERIL